MPQLSHLFHLTPADIWELTQEELEAYEDAAEEYNKAMSEAT